jgi:cysteinyl-tRNA synthetase
MIDSIFRAQNGLIDIHGGGFDLKFPHHENEIAQSRAHNHNELARYWMHNGFININNEKMSKSLGNVLLAKDVCKLYGGLAFRLMLLNAHYRAPVSFSDETILEAQKNVQKLKTAYKQLAVTLQVNGVDLASLKGEGEDVFFDAMCEDLNTPNALSIMYEETKVANQALRVRPLDLTKLGASFAKLRDYFFVLGLTFDYPTLSKEDIELYNRYNELKKEKRFEESDALRATLIEKGIL